MLSGCAESNPHPEKLNDRLWVGPGCNTSAQCAIGQICMHGRCVESPDRPAETEPLRPLLSATPGQLEFGTVAAGAERRLSVVLANDGEAMLTVRHVAIDGATGFRVESLGTGPFWIRPGRSRDLFVTYRGGGPAQGILRVSTEAPEIVVFLRAD